MDIFAINTYFIITQMDMFASKTYSCLKTANFSIKATFIRPNGGRNFP